MSVETIVVLVLTAIVAANLVWLELRSRRNARAEVSAQTPQGAAERDQAEAASPKKKAR